MSMAHPISLTQLDAALHSQVYVDVRRRIFRQLVESLIYEGIVEARMEPLGHHLLFRLSGQDEFGEPAVYLCQGSRRFSFGRIRLSAMPVMRMAKGTTVEAHSFSRFLWEIRSLLNADEDRLRRFTSELEQTCLNDTLAQFKRHQDSRPLRHRAYDELEGEVMDGHPYHPSYKSRMGFDHEDNIIYGPEFGRSLRPLWLAARRTRAGIAVAMGLVPEDLLRKELGEPLYATFMSEVSRRGRRPEDYILLPVHPWQWRECVLPAFHRDVRDGHLIPLGASQDAYRPQQSIRTLTNITAPSKAHLKLSLSIVNTSTSRILAPHTVQNAPLISDWLQRISQGDKFLREETRTVLLGEILGIVYHPSEDGLAQASTYGILACIWRESLHPFLSPGEEAVPFTALCHVTADGHPFIEPWIAKEGLERWARSLLEVSLTPIIHLLYVQGLALEAHAQNMILLHTNGRPTRIALKDFHDGIRFARRCLAVPHSRPALHATPPCHARINRNSYIETESAEDVRDFLHDALFFVNLSELALFLDERFGLQERRFWSMAHEVIRRYQQRFSHLGDRFAAFDLFAPTVQVEQLTKRRLFSDSEVRVHRVQNPLGQCGGRNGEVESVDHAPGQQA